MEKIGEVPDLKPAVQTVRITGPEHHLKTEQEKRLTEQEKIVVAYREEIRQLKIEHEYQREQLHKLYHRVIFFYLFVLPKLAIVSNITLRFINMYLYMYINY